MLQTDINLAPPLPYKDEIEHDVVTCKPRIPRYTQSNEFVFGQYEGHELILAMSFCSLIYYSNQGISSANGLIQLMNTQVCLS